MSKGKFILLAGGGILLIIILLFLVIKGVGPKPSNESISLQFWGTFDDQSYYDQAISEYEAIHKNVSIEYTPISFVDYESGLINSFASQRGPDIFLIHNTWLPKFADKISPLPQNKPSKNEEPIMTYKYFKENFVDVAVKDLTIGEDEVNRDIYAVPLYVDTLALFYNKDMFNTKGITLPPRTYQNLSDDVEKLTERDSRNRIVKSAIALGYSRNINRSTDILMMFMLQAGVRMTNSDHTQATFAKDIDGVAVGENALEYYTQFAHDSVLDLFTWDATQHYSIDAFAQGETAMMLNYSHHIGTLRDRAPRLNFGVAPAPQPEDADHDVTYASYWAPSVSKQSPNSLEAWKFLAFLSTTDATTSYLEASHRPAARKDLINEQLDDADLGVFAKQALSAVSWYQYDNIAVETEFANMIESVYTGAETLASAIRKAESRISASMRDR